MRLPAEDRYKLQYQEIGNLVRHYSTTRSALTSFLATVGLAAFANYHSSEKHLFLFSLVGNFMLVAALLACVHFSYQCERANLYARTLWNWFSGKEQEEPASFADYHPPKMPLVVEMLKDGMNWLCLLGIVSFVLGFHYST